MSQDGLRRTGNARNGCVTLSNSGFTTITSANPDRIHLTICNDSQLKVHLNFCHINSCQDDSGVYLPGESTWSMPTNNVYTGEICGKSDSDSPMVTYVEY
jgi:hypothetical protein